MTMTVMKTKTIRIAPPALLLGLAACGAPPTAHESPLPFVATPPVVYHAIAGGLLLTAGTAIMAEDGSFRIDAGAPFSTPVGQARSDCAFRPTAGTSNIGATDGARVRVQVPSLPEPLHGLLLLCGAPPSAVGASASRYLLEVPQTYVDATAGGLVSVVYESHRNAQQTDLPSQAWVLWLSRLPFPPASQVPPPTHTLSPASGR